MSKKKPPLGDDAQIRAMKTFAKEKDIFPPLERELRAESESVKAAPTNGKKPAQGKTGKPPRPSAEYDPAAIVERLGLWWLNGKDAFFRVPDDGSRVLCWNSRDVNRALRLEGVFKGNCAGKSYSHIDLVMDYVQRERHVDYAGPLAGKRVGVLGAQGRRILVTSSPRMIEPGAGDWPILRAVLTGLLATSDEDQTRWLYAWLKVGIEALRKGETRPGHGLIMAGPSDCGKSFVQEHVITQLLGGRSADPTKYLLAKTTFNAELAGAEHLCMQELPSGLDFKSRVLLADELKRLIATEGQAMHPKYCDAMTLFPWWRVTLSINDNVDRLKALPALTSDFGDKILLLLCQSHPMPMPTNTPEERRAFREVIAAELPAFVAFLLAWEIPAELRKTKHASRFGHDHFHHPRLTAALFDNEPESSLLYILDNSPALYIHGMWGWKASQALQDELCEMSEQARRLFNSRKGSFNNACGEFLSRLAERFPDRFKKKHTNQGNVWFIYEPAA